MQRLTKSKLSTDGQGPQKDGQPDLTSNWMGDQQPNKQEAQGKDGTQQEPAKQLQKPD